MFSRNKVNGQNQRRRVGFFDFTRANHGPSLPSPTAFSCYIFTFIYQKASSNSRKQNCIYFKQLKEYIVVMKLLNEAFVDSNFAAVLPSGELDET